MESNDKPGVTGIGGVFFKAKDQPALMAWYRDKLGIDMAEWGASFSWGAGTAAGGEGQTAFNIFKAESGYYPGSFMINFRVHRLRDLLEQLQADGVRMDEKVDEYSYGLFAWVYDPEGNKIELWEPIDAGFEAAE